MPESRIWIFALVCIFLKNVQSTPVTNHYSVLWASTPNGVLDFCVILFSEFILPPSEENVAKSHFLFIDAKATWCDEQPGANVTNKIVIAGRGNCSLTEEAANAQDSGAYAILFATKSGRVPVMDVNATEASILNISVGLISEKSTEKLTELGDKVSVVLFAPDKMSFDYSLICILFVSLGTIIIGSYWSGKVRYKLYIKETRQAPIANNHNHHSGSSSGHGSRPAKTYAPEPSTINVNPWAILVLVIVMGLMLLLVYFYFNIVVYFIIAMFTLGSVVALYVCLKPVVALIKINWKVGVNCCGDPVTLNIRKILIALFSIGMGIWWIIVRNDPKAWILQNTLGIAFCINMLRTIRLPNLQICTILLVLLFFYDIFFVFITPFITGAESIMEKVAVGGGYNGGDSGSGEMVPMVLRFPHISNDPLKTCFTQFSLLGYGDILVPGLFISYCFAFDLITGKNKLYWIVSIISYAVGLLLTFVALFTMSMAQPALLYLVPAVLLPVIILSICRGELKAMWIGFKAVSPKSSTTAGADTVPNGPPTSSTVIPVPTMNNSTEATVRENGTEKNHLLQS